MQNDKKERPKLSFDTFDLVFCLATEPIAKYLTQMRKFF